MELSCREKERSTYNITHIYIRTRKNEPRKQHLLSVRMRMIRNDNLQNNYYVCFPSVGSIAQIVHWPAQSRDSVGQWTICAILRISYPTKYVLSGSRVRQIPPCCIGLPISSIGDYTIITVHCVSSAHARKYQSMKSTRPELPTHPWV